MRTPISGRTMARGISLRSICSCFGFRRQSCAPRCVGPAHRIRPKFAAQPDGTVAGCGLLGRRLGECQPYVPGRRRSAACPPARSAEGTGVPLVEASLPYGWGPGGLVAEGGLLLSTSGFCQSPARARPAGDGGGCGAGLRCARRGRFSPGVQVRIASGWMPINPFGMRAPRVSSMSGRTRAVRGVARCKLRGREGDGSGDGPVVGPGDVSRLERCGDRITPDQHVVDADEGRHPSPGGIRSDEPSPDLLGGVPVAHAQDRAELSVIKCAVEVTGDKNLTILP